MKWLDFWAGYTYPQESQAGQKPHQGVQTRPPHPSQHCLLQMTASHQYPLTYRSTETMGWSVPLEPSACIPVPVPSPFQPSVPSDVLTGRRGNLLETHFLFGKQGMVQK